MSDMSDKCPIIAERYKIAERTARADLADLLHKSGETKSVKYLFESAE